MSVRKRIEDVRSGEGGWILIEVVVAGLLMVIVSLGVFTAFDSATRSSAEERHRARANALAEADISRMRSMRISDLSNLTQTRTVTQDGNRYTVTSRAEFQTDSTGTASCEAGAASADYIKVSSTVTWPSIGSRPPVVSASLVAPPNGSIAANRGALAVAVEDAANVGIPGVGITASGAGSFSGSTGATGCAIFGNLPAGNYTITVSGVASGLVDKDGNPPNSPPVQTSVVAESTNTLVLQFDEPGSAAATFTTQRYDSPFPVMASASDSLIAFNTGLSSARVFGTAGGAQQATLDATGLFPFTSDYALYAGSCEGDNPNPTGIDPPPAPAAIGSVLVPPGGSAPVAIRLPALHLNVFSGTSSTTPGTRVNGARVYIWDQLCGNPLRSFLTTDAGSPAVGGRLANPGLPFSHYTVCVSANIAGTFRRQRVPTTVSLNEPTDLTQRTELNVYLTGSGNTSGSQCGATSPG